MRPSDDLSRGAGARTTVAIAEDDGRVRVLLADLVSSDPSFHLVGTATDADEAIELGRRWQPDIMLLDVALPKGSGAQVVRALSVVSTGTRVLALSGYGDRDHVLQMLDAGAVGYLVKRADLDLLGALRSVAAGHSVLSEEVTGHLLEERASLSKGEASPILRPEDIRVTIDTKAFVVAFQPIFALRTGVAVGVEALYRPAPSRGLSPDIWFAEARAAGLDVELQLVVIASALESARHRPPGLFLSVNASPSVITDPRFLALIERWGEDRLVVEITEHDMVSDYDALNRDLQQARRRGVAIAVDDVGAGYANFRHVLNLRPQMVKLDVTLTAQIDVDPSRQALAKGLVAAARELGATVVAEGIETRAQFDTLGVLGIELGQGFYLARPGPLSVRFPMGSRS